VILWAIELVYMTPARARARLNECQSNESSNLRCPLINQDVVTMYTGVNSRFTTYHSPR